MVGRKVRQGHAQDTNTVFCLHSPALTHPFMLLTFLGSRSGAVSGPQLPYLQNKRVKPRTLRQSSHYVSGGGD